MINPFIKRLNALNAVLALGLPKKYYENVHRLLLTLDNPHSDYYNPYAAKILRAMLINIANNNSDDRAQRAVISFLGIYESLLVSVQGDSYSNLVDDEQLNIIALNESISKVELEEKISRLLYGTVKHVVAIENISPQVTFTSGGWIMILVAAKKYINNVYSNKSLEKDEKRLKIEDKINFLTDLSKKSNNSKDRTIRLLMVKALNSCKDTKHAGGQQFDRVFRELASRRHIDDQELIKKCIDARNMAVHQGKCQCDIKTLAFMIKLLLDSRPASSTIAASNGERARIEGAVAKEMAKDRRGRNVSLTVKKTIGIGVAATIVYAIGLILFGLFSDKPEVEKLKWPSSNHQLNARVNEAFATKDTTEVLEIKTDLEWIDEHL